MSRATTMSACFPTPIGSMRRVVPTGIWRSAPGCTSAWACIWRGWKCGYCSEELLDRIAWWGCRHAATLIIHLRRWAEDAADPICSQQAGAMNEIVACPIAGRCSLTASHHITMIQRSGVRPGRFPQERNSSTWFSNTACSSTA